mgnify:CR=1 FL=1
MTLRIGYKASAEQFGPRELLDSAVEAERLGLDSVMVSDPFQPLRHQGGQAPVSAAWLAASTIVAEPIAPSAALRTSSTYAWGASTSAKVYRPVASVVARWLTCAGYSDALNRLTSSPGCGPACRS